MTLIYDNCILDEKQPQLCTCRRVYNDKHEISAQGGELPPITSQGRVNLPPSLIKIYPPLKGQKKNFSRAWCAKNINHIFFDKKTRLLLVPARLFNLSGA